MEHLKKKIIEELRAIDYEIENTDEFHEEQLYLACKLAKAHFYLCKLESELKVAVK